jgi:hypothetical protein
MSAITEILDRLSGVEVVKEKLRDTGARLERWAGQVVEIDRQVQAIDRRLVRIETFVEVADVTRKTPQRRLPKAE